MSRKNDKVHFDKLPEVQNRIFANITTYINEDKELKKKVFMGDVWGNLPKRKANAECVLTGNGLMVVDIDTKDLSKVDKKLVRLLGEPTVETARGYHYYFIGNVDGVKQTQKLFEYVDIRNEGGLVFHKYWGDSKDVSYKRIGAVVELKGKLKKYLEHASTHRAIERRVNIAAMVEVDGTWGEIPHGEVHSTSLALMVNDFSRGLTYNEVYSKAMLYIDKYADGNHESKDALYIARLDDAFAKYGNENFQLPLDRNIIGYDAEGNVVRSNIMVDTRVKKLLKKVDEKVIFDTKAFSKIQKQIVKDFKDSGATTYTKLSDVPLDKFKTVLPTLEKAVVVRKKDKVGKSRELVVVDEVLPSFNDIETKILEDENGTENIDDMLKSMTHMSILEQEKLLTHLKNRRGVALGTLKQALKGHELANRGSMLRVDYADIKESPVGGSIVLPTLANMRTLLKKCEVKYHYDVILKDVIVNNWSGENNWKGKLRSHVTSEGYKDDIPKAVIEEHYDIALRSKEKNPLVATIKKQNWDGKDYIAQLATLLHSDTGSLQYREAVLTKWLVQCVSAWDGAQQSPRRDKIRKYEYIFVLGGNQGVNKTTFFTQLMPKKMKRYLKTGVQLRLTDKDSIKQTTSYGMVELGELEATFKKSDIEELKAFTSNEFDEYRVAYGRDDERHPRRTSFCASVNTPQFLNDASGARRFLYLNIIKRIDITKFNVMQMWAQAWSLYLGGESWWFEDSQKKMLEEQKFINEEATEGGVVGDIVREFEVIVLQCKGKTKTRMSPTRLWEKFTDKTPNTMERSRFIAMVKKIEGVKYEQHNGFTIPFEVLAKFPR